MKTLKLYIKESLFDDEEDLLDRAAPDESIYNYLESIKFSRWDNIRKLFNIKKGIIYGANNINQAFLLIKPLPSYINFDKNSCSQLKFYISYNNITQEQIDRLPGCVASINSNKISNLIIPTGAFIDLTSVDNFNKIKLDINPIYNQFVLCFDDFDRDDLKKIEVCSKTHKQIETGVLKIYDDKSYEDFISIIKADTDLTDYLLNTLKCNIVSGSDYCIKFLDNKNKPTFSAKNCKWKKRRK